MYDYDVIIATDLRFPGGSSASTLEEIHTNFSAGWKTGLVHLPASMIKGTQHRNKSIARAITQQLADEIPSSSTNYTTKLLMFRHPSTIGHEGGTLPDVRPEHLHLIINHPPNNAHGRVDYDLREVARKLESKYGVKPKLFPIGPLIRKRLIDHYQDEICLEKQDWLNIFDIERFSAGRKAPKNGKLVIGRHSRPGAEKWPERLEKLLAAYPDSPDWDVRILGGIEQLLPTLGSRPKHWTVHEFGTMAPEEFLQTIDVFVYFHHSRWLEAFGRVIIEAMASGLPVVVPHHFKPLLKNAAIYCTEEEVMEKLEGLRDPDVFNRWSKVSSEFAADNFGRTVHIDRMKKLGFSIR